MTDIQKQLVDELDMDLVLSIADAHANKSFEDGRRLLDRGGLLQFAKDLIVSVLDTDLQQEARGPLTRSQIIALIELPELAGTEFPNKTAFGFAVARAIEAAHGIKGE